jgi:hypothetical protein
MMGPSWRKMFCSKSTRANTDRILRDPCIEVHLHTKVGELIGERGVLEGVGVEDIEDGSRFTLPASEVMVFVGADPCTAWLAGTLALDSGGYVRTGPDAVSPDRERVGGPCRHPSCWRPTSPASSRRSMWAADRSSGWRPRSVKGRWDPPGARAPGAGAVAGR